MRTLLIIAALLGIVLAGCKKDKNNKVTWIDLNKTETTIVIGKSEQLLVLQMWPPEITDVGVTWSSDNTARATVDDTGMVTVPATATAGTVNITATANDGGGAKATCVITVPRFGIGQAYQGGIIAYIDETGEHGLIAAPQDQSDGAVWGNYLIRTNVTGTAIGTGKSNTTELVRVIREGNIPEAALLCDRLVLNGYDDWFLPSRDELYELYKNRNAIGGFANDWYWSSSESTSDGSLAAWTVLLSDGGWGGCLKNVNGRVRAVRYF